jgi:coenzyme F420-reducing hydrogenase alpha subunit
VVGIKVTYGSTVDEQNKINELNIITTVAFIEATCEMMVDGQSYFYLNMSSLVVNYYL